MRNNHPRQSEPVRAMDVIYWIGIAVLVIAAGLTAADIAHGHDGPCLMPPFPGDDSLQAVTAERVQPQVSPGVWDRMKAVFTGEYPPPPTEWSPGIDEPGDGIEMAGHLRRLRTGAFRAPGAGSGAFNVLVVLCSWLPTPTDTILRPTPTLIDSLVFSDQGHTVREYYEIMSQGQVNFTTVHLPSSLGWNIVPKSKSYYVNNNYGFGSYPYNTQKMVEDLVDLIDPIVDFSLYDNDGNGYCDGVIVVQSGSGAELSGKTTDIWSHKWGISPRLKDGVYVSNYAVNPSHWRRAGDMTIGVYAHETGHIFGLPDLYDLDNSSRGLGKWSLMAGGSWNGNLGNRPAPFLAWERFKLGFAEPIQVTTSPARVSLEFMDILQVYATPQASPYQFWASYHHQQLGSYYDGGLPSWGLVIEIVDETQGSNSKEWWPGKSGAGHYKVAVAQADSLWHLEHNSNSGDGGDPWPWFKGGPATNYQRTFDPLWYDGTDPGVMFDSITLAADRQSVSLVVRRDWVVPGCVCPHQGDFDADGTVDYDDLMAGYAVVFFGATGTHDGGCPLSRLDVDGNGYVDATDMAYLGDHLQGLAELPDPCTVN